MLGYLAGQDCAAPTQGAACTLSRDRIRIGILHVRLAPVAGQRKRGGAVRIQVLGTGNARNREFVANVQRALQELGLAAAVESVESIHQMVQLGVMSMPALAVDGEVKSAGRLLTSEEIKEVLSP